MKLLLLLAVFTSSLFISTDLKAQDEVTEYKKPTWVSDQGYWVVETNKKTPKNSIVYFYNNAHLMVYKEEIKNQKLNLKRKKTLMRLHAALEESIAKYEQGTLAQQNILWAKLQQD